MKRRVPAFLLACLLLAVLGCPNPTESKPAATSGPDSSPGASPGPVSGAYLSSITLSGGLSLSPAFNRDTFIYAVQVPNAITSLTVSGTADSGCSASPAVTLSGLAVGVSQTATIIATAGDGSSRSYTVAATRWPVVPPASENLFINGGFDDGKFGWSQYAMTGASVSAQVVNGEIRIDSNPTPSRNTWDCIFFSGVERPVTLRRDKAYLLSFDAYSPGGAYVWINFQERGRDLNGDGNLYSSYASGGFSLTSTKTTYSLPLTMGNQDDDLMEFQVQTGQATSPVFLDNMVLKETGEGNIGIKGTWISDISSSIPFEVTNAKFSSSAAGMEADIVFYDNSSRSMVVRFLAHPSGAIYVGQYDKISWDAGTPVNVSAYSPSSTIAGALAVTTVEYSFQLTPPSNNLRNLASIAGDGSVDLAWLDPTHPDTVAIRASWDGGSRTLPIGIQTIHIDGLTNGQAYTVQLDSLSAASTVLANAYATVTPSESATNGTMEVWVGPAPIQFGSSVSPADQGYVQVGITVDISNLDADLALAYDISVANQYLAIYYRNKFAKVDCIEYLDAGGNVVGHFAAGANGEVRQANRSNLDWLDTEASILALDGAYMLLGTPGWYSSIGMQYGPGVDFTRIRIRLVAD